VQKSPTKETIAFGFNNLQKIITSLPGWKEFSVGTESRLESGAAAIAGKFAL
jgi:hypothetical protein